MIATGMSIRAAAAVVLLAAASAFAAEEPSPPRLPHIGYLYPAGGQAGTTVQIIAGGQFLRGAVQVHVSGDGVEARIVRHFAPNRPLDKDQRMELRRQIAQAINGRPIAAEPSATQNAEAVKLPDNFLWYNLEDKTPAELAHLVWTLMIPRDKQQQNRQLSETALLELTIAPDAAPGDRQIRLIGMAAVSNPMTFQVGTLPETRELEPNHDDAIKLPGFETLPKTEPLKLPVTINGQMMPSDVDRFQFFAERGQSLVIAVQARHLIPYLADAVPGWFQAAITLYDDHKKEVAFADDYRFDPDPVLFFTVPATGIYELEIRDAIYRGREDFVYRVSIGALPFITSMFPLGGKEGTAVDAAIDGYNLPAKRLPLRTTPGTARRQTRLQDESAASNPMVYAVDTLPEAMEAEPNDAVEQAQPVTLPVIVNGRIDRPQDEDVFVLEGRKGQTLAIEVTARRLYSSLDSLVRLMDADGTVVQWNDDYVVSQQHLYLESTGVLTHSADSYLMAELPQDGRYYVQVADAQGHGGADFGYRLRISEPMPDFELRVTPSGVSIWPGQTAQVSAYVLPKDGFDGDIELRLVGAPRGLVLNDTVISARNNPAQLTLSAGWAAAGTTRAIRLEGRATFNGSSIRRQAIAADDVMQAFLYRHLAPAQEWLVSVPQPRKMRPLLQ